MIQIVNKHYHSPDPLRDVYVGRGTALGNPYTVEDWGREGAIEKYKAWLIESAKDDPEVRHILNAIYQKLMSTGNINLVCYCAPQPCHAEVIRDLVMEKVLAKASATTLPLAQAKEIAQHIKTALSPYCDRIEIAGSIRRKKQKVGDVEIVCIPKKETLEKMIEPGVFEEPNLFNPLGGWVVPPTYAEVTSVVEGFYDTVSQWHKVNGELDGKYTQRLFWSKLTGFFKVDIFIAHPDNWGWQLAIRTGSAAFSKMLGIRWSRLGFMSEGGILYDQEGQDYPIREEGDLFRLLHMEWVAPEDRENVDALMPII